MEQRPAPCQAAVCAERRGLKMAGSEGGRQRVVAGSAGRGALTGQEVRPPSRTRTFQGADTSGRSESWTRGVDGGWTRGAGRWPAVVESDALCSSREKGDVTRCLG